MAIVYCSPQLKELKQFKLFSIEGIPPPAAPTHSDSHPCISPPLGGHFRHYQKQATNQQTHRVTILSLVNSVNCLLMDGNDVQPFGNMASLSHFVRKPMVLMITPGRACEAAASDP